VSQKILLKLTTEQRRSMEDGNLAARRVREARNIVEDMIGLENMPAQLRLNRDDVAMMTAGLAIQNMVINCYCYIADKDQ
jgi:hypothetical protein